MSVIGSTTLYYLTRSIHHQCFLRIQYQAYQTEFYVYNMIAKGTEM